MTSLRERMTEDLRLRSDSPRTVQCFVWHGRWLHSMSTLHDHIGLDGGEPYIDLDLHRDGVLRRLRVTQVVSAT